MKKIKSLIYALSGFGLVGMGTLAHAAPPLANTPIGNQAKATYTDDSNVVREVFSNTVVTRVSQISALSLVQDNSRIATRGSQVYFPHTVTNLGNGLDSFDLSAIAGGDVTLQNVNIYPDSNQDGLPDNFTPITVTPDIAPGAEFHFVVVGLVPVTAPLGDTGTVLVTATSDFDNAETANNTDTFTVTNNAVMQVTKGVDISSGTPGTGPITYTLTYTNTGNSAATDFTLSDTIPAGMSYIPGSARWHQSGGTPMDDDVGGDPAGIEYDFGDTEANTATFVIANVPVGQSGFVTFQVEVDAGVVPGIINNQAQYEFETGGAPAGPFGTNVVPFLVTQVADVSIEGDTVASATAGSTVRFDNVLTNDGNGTDTFDILLSGSSFPAGTTFQLFQQDGETPMTDSNGNGVPDTGPVAPGATYTVVLKAILPGNVADGTGPFEVTKTARSTFDSDVTDTAVDTLTSVTGASVDLTANTALPGAPGEGVIGTPTTGDDVIITNTANPGTTTVFTLVVNNTGPAPDSYNLTADMALPFGTNNQMLEGWTVVFRNSGGSVVSNTGTIASGASGTYTASIFVPAGTPPGDNPVFFRVQSPVTGAIDHMQNVVDVNTVRSITIQTDNVGQTFPGGSVEYEHILTNNGNVTEGNAGGDSEIDFSLVDTLVGSGFTSIIYYDVDDNGTLDPSDPVVSGDNLAAVKAGGLAPGESIRLFVKVFAPLGAPDSATNATTITVTTDGVIDGVVAPAPVANTDTTTVIRGDLIVIKRQAIDTNGNGVIDGTEGPFVQTQLSAPPGAVIIYQITVTNAGSADATAITVNDTIPSNTTYFRSGAQGTANVTGDGSVNEVDSEPNDGETGAFVFDIGTLEPQGESVITFGVQINE